MSKVRFAKPWLVARSIGICAVMMLISLPAGADAPSDITEIAKVSSCAQVNWKQRGTAPRSYIKGMALTYARAICHPERQETKIASQAENASDVNHDGVAFYSDVFAAKQMSNSQAGLETLRHTYTLLIGLGMMESSGKYCEGRDVSQCFAEADSAEAGLFQTSWGVNRASPVLAELFTAYKNGDRDCFLETFKSNVSCTIHRSHNPACPDATSDIAGTGEGAEWQRMSKSCPAFAAEYAAIVLRKSGGKRGEFNPIRKKEAEVRSVCDSMLSRVQDYIKSHPDACSQL